MTLPERARQLTTQIVYENPDLAASLLELLSIISNPRGREDRDRIAWAEMRFIYNFTENCEEGFKQDLARLLGEIQHGSELSS